MNADVERNQCGLFLKSLFQGKPSGTVVMGQGAGDHGGAEAKAFNAWSPKRWR